MKYVSSFGWRAGMGGLIVIGLIAFLGSLSLKHARMQRLFAEPYELCPREEPAYYSPVEYDLSQYSAPRKNPDSAGSDSDFATRSHQDEIAYVDGEARGEVEAAMRSHAGKSGPQDQTTNPLLDRLVSPTAYRDRAPSKTLRILSPENEALFPPNLCAPYVEWEDPRNQIWQVILRREGETEEQVFVSETKRWRIPDGLWRRLASRPGSAAELRIRGAALDEKGQRTGPVQETPPVRFRISEDKADDFVVYRSVEPPFSSLKTPDIYIRNIGEDRSRLFLNARRQYCLNCHTFSSTNGTKAKMALQVRNLVSTGHKLQVYLAIFDLEKHAGRKVQLPFEIQMSAFMAWSPDSRQLAYSANQKIAALQPIVYETQLAGMATSDVAVYDTETNETWLVPGASDPNLLEIYPRWSPDGRTMVFSRSPVGLHPNHILFDLYRMDWNGEGGTPQPIEGASANGRSNYFPHYSPDGKWFSFCQSDGGDLIRSSSDLYLLTADLKGPARRLECNSDFAADSWHSWSSNSRWLVFASKRRGGVFASLYMTHIDDAGHASPVVELPTAEYPTASCNIPEFLSQAPNVEESELYETFRVETAPVMAQLRKIDQGNRHE